MRRGMGASTGGVRDADEADAVRLVHAEGSGCGPSAAAVEGRGVIANLPENLAIIVDCKTVTFQALSGFDVIEVETQGRASWD